MLFLAATNRNPAASVRKGDAGTVEAQVALLERTVAWLAERPGIVTPAHARKLGQAVERTAALRMATDRWVRASDRPRPSGREQVDRSDNRPDLSVGDWVLFDGRLHLIRSIRRNPWTGEVLHIHLTAEDGANVSAPFGLGVEKIR